MGTLRNPVFTHRPVSVSSVYGSRPYSGSGSRVRTSMRRVLENVQSPCSVVARMPVPRERPTAIMTGIDQRFGARAKENPADSLEPAGRVRTEIADCVTELPKQLSPALLPQRCLQRLPPGFVGRPVPFCRTGSLILRVLLAIVPEYSRSESPRPCRRCCRQ